MLEEQKNNFIFWGTPEVARETLETLKENGYLPSLIVTAPDRPQGRKLVITPTPVKVWAIENNIPYIQPEKITQEQIHDVLQTLGRSGNDGQRKFSAENFRGEQNIMDLFLIIAYGKILPEKLINMPRLGSINIHYSLLPRWRGASPVEAAVLAGDTETGVTIQQMEFKMDTGPILAIEKTNIGETETAPELKKRLTKIGAELLVKTLPDIFAQNIKPVVQDESEATYCKKIKKEDGLVDPENDDPVELYNKFRAYKEWPRIYYFKKPTQDVFVNGLGESKTSNRGPEQKHLGRRVIITGAVLKNGKFVIKKIIPEGKKEITVD